MLNSSLEELPKYTGQSQDIEVDFYYYGSRYYDAILGRFIQPDSIIPDVYSSQSLNPYAYVLNNPLKYTDPTGHYTDPREDDPTTSADNPIDDDSLDRVPLSGEGTVGDENSVKLAKPRYGKNSANSNAASVNYDNDNAVFNPQVRSEMEKAFAESGDYAQSKQEMREQGGWIVEKNGEYYVERWQEGDWDRIRAPIFKPNNTVGEFHTHPFGGFEGFAHEPSADDIKTTPRYNFPSYIIDRRSIMRVDPSRPETYYDVILR